MPRINRSLTDPHGGFIGRPHTRDRMKRQSEHDWLTVRPRRPTIEELLKENMEGTPEWANGPQDFPDV